MSRPDRVGIVSGSGIDLSGLLSTVTKEQGFEDIPGLVATGVEGHESRFLHGVCGKKPVVLQCGRLHLYEGLSYSEVARTVDVMKSFGVRTILFTNAAGGLDPAMQPGDLMAVERLQLWPYRRWLDMPDTLPTDFTVPGCAFTGTYMWVHGPTYETRSEVAALRRLGAEAVGMSTAPEIARCRELGLRAGVIACITNNCHHPEVLTHERVVNTARQASGKLTALIREALLLVIGR